VSGSERVTREALLDLLRGDRELFEMLQEVGIIPERDLAPVEVEEVLVARTLVRELDVNLAGVEVVLRLRAELQETRLQVKRLMQAVHETGRQGAKESRDE
jgi:hypothetical protein